MLRLKQAKHGGGDNSKNTQKKLFNVNVSASANVTIRSCHVYCLLIEFEIFNNVWLKTKAVCAFANAHNLNCRLSETKKIYINAIGKNNHRKKMLSIAYMCTKDYFKPSIMCFPNDAISIPIRFRIAKIYAEITKIVANGKNIHFNLVYSYDFYSKIVFDYVIYI